MKTIRVLFFAILILGDICNAGQKHVFISLEIIEVNCTHYPAVFEKYSKAIEQATKTELNYMCFELEHTEAVNSLILQHCQVLDLQNKTALSTWLDSTELNLSFTTDGTSISLSGSISYEETESFKAGKIQLLTITPLKIGSSAIIHAKSETNNNSKDKVIRFVRVQADFNRIDDFDLSVPSKLNKKSKRVDFTVKTRDSKSKVLRTESHP